MIYVDADACPVIGIIEKTAKEFSLPVTLICDTSHIISSDYSTVLVVGKGNDAVDFNLVNRAQKGDVVVTQDYGLAAMVLAKGAYAINQNGIVFDSNNIGLYLDSRYFSGKARRESAKCHLKGPKKRSKDDDERFYKALHTMLNALKC